MELVTDAWAHRAPARLVKTYRAGRPPPEDKSSRVL
jgi:hypothetical protein